MITPEPIRSLFTQAVDDAEPPLQRLFAAASLHAQLEQWLPALAAAARDEGHSWADVGSVLGVTKQAAQQRLGKTSVVWDPATGELRQSSPEEAQAFGQALE